MKQRDQKLAPLKKPIYWKYIVAAFIVLFNSVQLYVLLEMSLKEPTDLASRLTWPDYIYFGNYLKILENHGQSNLLNGFKNTIIITTCVVAIEIFAGCLAAYPLARLQTKFNECVRSINLAIMMVPPVSILVGVYSILVKMNGINTYWALILVTAAFGLPMSIYLYTNYISSIPRALDEAARIDGANRFQCFLHIILPQLKPVTVTVIIMKGIGAWNDYLYPMYIMQRPKMYTVVLVIKQYFSEMSTDLYGAAACCVLAMLPIIALYIFLNKYFIQGAVDSAVK